MSNSYTIEEHNHRLAAWDASRSASASPVCRFKVQQGLRILESCGFDAAFSTPEQLPSPQHIDDKHKEWREAIIKAAKEEGRTFSHGIAAKLINSYLKVRFVCAGQQEHERVKCLHPPIDAVLLDELAKQNVGRFKQKWRDFHQQRWSKFDSDTYESVIKCIRKSIPGEPLWKIEQYWRGYQ